MSTKRRRAFTKPAPDGWTPALDDEVFLPPRSPWLNSARGVVTLLIPEHAIAKVKYWSSRRFYEDQFLVADLRPTGRRLEWRGDERRFVMIGEGTNG